METKPCKQKPNTHVRTPNCDKIDLDGPGEARQGYSTTAQQSDTILLPLSEWTTNYEWDGNSGHVWHTWFVPVLCCWHTRTNAKNHVFFVCFFNLMLVRYLPGLGISEIRGLFIRGPIWIRLINNASFCVGQVPGTSRRRDKTEEAHMWTTHLSLVVGTFCIRPRLQFVRGCPKRPWCDTYTRYNGSSFSSFPPLFFVFFLSAGS